FLLKRFEPQLILSSVLQLICRMSPSGPCHGTWTSLLAAPASQSSATQKHVFPFLLQELKESHLESKLGKDGFWDNHDHGFLGSCLSWNHFCSCGSLCKTCRRPSQSMVQHGVEGAQMKTTDSAWELLTAAGGGGSPPHWGGGGRGCSLVGQSLIGFPTPHVCMGHIN
ncbi:mCG146033, partial [Mus musculus]